MTRQPNTGAGFTGSLFVRSANLGCRDLSFALDVQQIAGACNDEKLRIWNLQK